MNNTPQPHALMPDLTGVELDGGWIVGEKDEKRPGESGRTFSVCYKVTHKDNGDAYFLKAFDFYTPLANSNPQTFGVQLQQMINAFVFEEALLRECRGSDRVVTAVASGQYRPNGQIVPVPYLIFELGAGDIRRHLGTNELPIAWKVRAFHHIATGVLQVHGKDVAHQDLKPSNAVVFKTHTGVADLGRASKKDVDGPWDGLHFPGDPNYMPPEFQYGYSLPDFDRRRQGADVYMLGALGVFLFTGIALNAIVREALSSEYHPGNWNDPYEKVLDYYREAFYKALDRIRAQLPPGNLGDELLHIFTWLCDPNPVERGYIHMGEVKPAEFSLNKLVTKLDQLAVQADIEARKNGEGTSA